MRVAALSSASGSRVVPLRRLAGAIESSRAAGAQRAEPGAAAPAAAANMRRCSSIPEVASDCRRRAVLLSKKVSSSRR